MTLPAIYLVRLRPDRGLDDASVIRNLRHLLKFARRRLGLIAVTINQEGAMEASIEIVRAYIDQAIASFEHDPPDSQFQKGFLEALRVVRREAFDEPASTSSE
jgi:hypothetical protein